MALWAFSLERSKDTPLHLYALWDALTPYRGLIRYTVGPDFDGLI